MALEGSLREFNLADIFQLLHFQRKTGVLTIAGKSDKIRLLFNEGQIVAAESQKRDVAGRLGRVLVSRGIITEEALDQAIERQKDSGMRLGAILLAEGRATPEDIKAVLSFQISEAVNQLFTWKEGRYDFTPQAVPMDQELSVSLDTQHVLMEGLRLLDEWTQLGDMINVDTVLVPTEKPSTDVTDEEVRILAFVDGVNDVGTIADLTGVDSFNVSMLLLDLVQKGMVAKKETITAQDVARVRIYIPPPPVPQLPLVLAFMLIVSLAIGVGLVWGLGDLRAFKAARQIDRIRTTIEMQQRMTGSYPATIEGTDPWGTPYVYSATAQGFTIFSAGPDKTPGTPDDIH